jgi:hypothetical protein
MASTSAYGVTGLQSVTDSRPDVASDAVLVSIAQEVVASITPAPIVTAQAAAREEAGETFTH